MSPNVHSSKIIFYAILTCLCACAGCGNNPDTDQKLIAIFYAHRDGIPLTNLDNAGELPANCYMRPIESNWFIAYHRDED